MTEVERQTLRQLHPSTSRGLCNAHRCLILFDRRDGITIEEAATVAGKSARTMRLWCEQHQIGRRVGGGRWVVSIVALRMLLNDLRTLQIYLAGDRSNSTVVGDYEQDGLRVLRHNWRPKALAGRPDPSAIEIRTIDTALLTHQESP